MHLHTPQHNDTYTHLRMLIMHAQRVCVCVCVCARARGLIRQLHECRRNRAAAVRDADGGGLATTARLG
jgi:hypothetical protein